MDKNFATAWLAQLVEHRTAARKVEGLNPGRTNIQGPKLTDDKVLIYQLLFL